MDPQSPLLSVSQASGGPAFSLDIQTLLIVTALAFLPGIVLLMTSSRGSSWCLRSSGRRWG